MCERERERERKAFLRHVEEIIGKPVLSSSKGISPQPHPAPRRELLRNTPRVRSLGHLRNTT